jgi:methylmalonyl-CoA/ethylmalonyl-CoA epimerase
MEKQINHHTGVTMSTKLRHIAISVPDPWKTAEFYVNAFGFRKVGETDSSLARGVYLSDGVMSIALLNYKTDEAAGERGRDFVGLHHIGMWVDEIGAARASAEAAGGTYYMGEVPVKGNIFYEVKYRDPNGVIVDLTDHGWGGAVKDVGADASSAGPALRHPDLVADRSGIS